MRRKRSLLKQSVLIIALVGVFGIILYNTKDLLFGAPLSVTTVKDGMALSESYLTVSGIAPHAKALSINGRTISTNRKGEFSEPILLAPGYNVLEVGMVDRFGKKNTKHYQLTLSEEGDRFTFAPEPRY